MRLPRLALPTRRPRPTTSVAPGERVLAHSPGGGGEVAGTRDALYLPGPGGTTTRLPWHHVDAAEWDADAGVLVVREVAGPTAPGTEHRLALGDPALLLQLVRERVTASVLLTRHTTVRPGLQLRVVARRAPHGERAVTWGVDLDEGLDPGDPVVARAAERALAQARGEVGDEGGDEAGGA